MTKKRVKDVTKNPLYHDTWKLLQKYRDVIWSLELSIQDVHSKFYTEYGTSIEEFLDAVYVAGADLSGTEIEHHARCIRRSAQMIKLINNAVEILHTKHKDGEAFYWILYFTYLTPQRFPNTQAIIDMLRPHIRDISYSTYFRRRQDAIDALSSVLWGYSSRDTLDALAQFFPQEPVDQ